MKKIKVIIGVLIIIVGVLIAINGLFDKKAPYVDSSMDITETNVYTNEIKNKVYMKKKSKKKSKKKKKTTKTFKISYNKNTILEYTYQLVKSYGWNDKDYQAVVKILQRESGINPNSVNRSSGACGLFQAYPCNKTIKNGYKDYYTNWKTQVRWGLDYIKYRYKTPSKAWSFWQKHHWY